MKSTYVIRILLAAGFVISLFVSHAQVINPGKAAEEKGTERLNTKIDEGIDAGLNNLEEGIGNLFRKKKRGGDNENSSAVSSVTGEEGPTDDRRADEPNGSSPQAQQIQPKLESYTNYDFVPGDKVIWFEDFSEVAVGDFPALWTSNGSAEVKTVNIAPGKWFHLNGEDAVYCFMNQIEFPQNFIIEFDIIPDEEYQYGTTFTLYEENLEEPRELNDDLYPGIAGLHITLKKDGWETKGYSNTDDADWIVGEASKNPLVQSQVNHVIIWIQNRRTRIYHQGAKVIDMPTNIYAGTAFSKFRFSGWDAHSWPMISNFKITTASPDMRSKLITDGKLITYGITFDVNKAEIRHESYGTLKGIAEVLKENPGIRVRIAGHTDSDGDDAFNLDLSKRRAEAVKTELVKSFGLNPDLFETDGLGETQPVAPNDTPANKAQNRRVEIIKI